MKEPIQYKKKLVNKANLNISCGSSCQYFNWSGNNNNTVCGHKYCTQSFSNGRKQLDGPYTSFFRIAAVEVVIFTYFFNVFWSPEGASTAVYLSLKISPWLSGFLFFYSSQKNLSLSFLKMQKKYYFSINIWSIYFTF